MIRKHRVMRHHQHGDERAQVSDAHVVLRVRGGGQSWPFQLPFAPEWNGLNAAHGWFSFSVWLLTFSELRSPRSAELRCAAFDRTRKIRYTLFRAMNAQKTTAQGNIFANHQLIACAICAVFSGATFTTLRAATILALVSQQNRAEPTKSDSRRKAARSTVQ